MALCCGVVGSTASAEPRLDSEVKAAYIYRFLDYVTWPAQSFRSAEEPVLIGTLLEDDVAAELSRLVRERTVQGRRLQVVMVKDEREPAVHVMYVPKLESGKAGRVLEAARQRPILVVTDLPDGLDRGGVINFVPAGGRIQFEVSLEAAGRAGLEISSRLLAVAIRVRKSDSGWRPYAGAPSADTLARGWLPLGGFEDRASVMLSRHAPVPPNLVSETR
jgi:hypothetical protein